MKTAFIQDFSQSAAPLLAWLQQGETVALLKENGQLLGKFVPEQPAGPGAITEQQELYRRRFAPLASVPQRDLSDIVAENRGHS